MIQDYIVERAQAVRRAGGRERVATRDAVGSVMELVLERAERAAQKAAR